MWHQILAHIASWKSPHTILVPGLPESTFPCQRYAKKKSLNENRSTANDCAIHDFALRLILVVRFQLRTLLEQLPSPDNINFRSLLILSQVTPQAPLLVVSMPSNYIIANHPKEKHQTLIRDRKRNEASGLLV